MAAEQLPAPIAVGTVLAERYRVDGVIGAGGMSVIAAATDLVARRSVAVKLLRPTSDDGGRAERLEREVRALEAVRGEHVAELLDAGVQPSGAPFFVMERLEGQSLSDLIVAAGHLPVERAADFLLMACQALTRAHTLGIVHRDLKPSNLFVARAADGQRTLKVLDFGIAKLVEAGDRALTASTDRLGTARYMSPEQLTSPRDVTARTDLWALGVVLYEMLTGTRPFDGEHDAAVAYAVVHGEPTPLRRLRPDVPAEIEAIVTRCLAKDPAERFASAKELAEALSPFASPDRRARAGAIAATAGEPSAGAETVEGTGPAWAKGARKSFDPPPGRGPWRRLGVVAFVVTVGVIAAAAGRLSASNPERGDAASSIASAAPSPSPGPSRTEPQLAPPTVAPAPPSAATSAEVQSPPSTPPPGPPPSQIPAATRRTDPSAVAAPASARSVASSAPPCPDPHCSRD